MILNKSQAEAVYCAVCALNNVNGDLKAEVQDREGCSIFISASQLGGVVIGRGLRERENYKLQCDFATAYGLAEG